jgi:Transglutaminase-like superfamily
MSLRLAAEAVGLRALLPVMLRVLPLERTLRLVTPELPVDAAPPADARAKLAVFERIERVTDTLTRELPGLRTACLKRALMRYVLLRRSGVAARFVIGVRPGGPDGFEAHAWVTLDGQVIMERDTPDYRSTLVWPREAA